MSIKSTLPMIIAMCAICAFAQAQNAAASSKKAAHPETASCYATFNTALPNFCVTADASPATNYFDGTINSAWGYQSAAVSYPNHGLTIRANQSVHNFFGYNVPLGSYDPCDFSPNSVGSPTYGDEAVLYMFTPNGNSVIPTEKSITVTLEYRPM
jgi:hypothetical protein